MNRRLTRSAYENPTFFPLRVALVILSGLIDVPETDAEDRVWPPQTAERSVVSKQSNTARIARPAVVNTPPLPNNWMTAAPYSQIISRYAFVQNGEDIYVISGFSGGTNTDAVNRYNATANTWTPLAPIPTKSQAPCAAYYNGKIYVADGNAGNGFQIYDVATNTWSAGPPRPGVTDSFGAAAAAYIGKVYIVGGQTTGGITTTSIYDINSNSWSAGPAAPAPVHFGGYTHVNQFLYVVGGTGPGSPANNLNVSIRLDMTNNTWSIGPTWTPARQDFALAAVGTKLFAIGGDLNGGTFFDESTQVDELETAAWPAGTWVASPNPLPSGQQGNQAGFFSIGRAGGEIWSTGGFQPATAEHLFRAIPCVITFHGAIGSNSTTYPGMSGIQTNRISRARDPSTCGVSPDFTTQPGSFAFDSYVFTNKGPASCVTFTFDTACRATQEVFAVAYTGSFNPANVATNHAGDMGRSLPFSNNFSVNVPANSHVVLVVSEVVAGGACPDYTVTVTGLHCLCEGARVGIAYADTGGAPSQLRAALLAEPGITSVDLFNANTGTLTVAQLQDYDIIVPFSNSGFNNATTLGNNLADYVDGGGLVVQLGFSFHGPASPLGINGRWVSGGYSPYTYTASLTNNVVNTLGTNDGTNPLMEGVTTLRSNFHNIVPLSAGAIEVAAWNNNDSLLAYKSIPGGHVTFGMTAYLGQAATWTGDFARVIANAGRWVYCRPLQLTSAVSRKLHGATAFDINVPLTGEPGVECRSGGASKNHTLVFTFNSPVVAANAVATSSLGTGNGMVQGSPTFSNNTMTVNLTGVTDQQKITVALNNITGAAGEVLPPTTVSMNVLLGDTSGNKIVNSTDVSQTKLQSGAAISAANFRSDNTVNGIINATDVSQVKLSSGHGVP
jgi:hypothetical protein